VLHLGFDASFPIFLCLCLCCCSWPRPGISLFSLERVVLFAASLHAETLQTKVRGTPYLSLALVILDIIKFRSQANIETVQIFKFFYRGRINPNANRNHCAENTGRCSEVRLLRQLHLTVWYFYVSHNIKHLTVLKLAIICGYLWRWYSEFSNTDISKRFTPDGFENALVWTWWSAFQSPAISYTSQF
jgi:hypothetical protein